jgi:hypothetical protein
MLLTSKGKSNTRTAQELIASSIDTLVQALEAGHSDILSSYLKAMGRFHTYSFGNILLIATQKPTATHVAGIRTWNQLGRAEGEESLTTRFSRNYGAPGEIRTPGLLLRRTSRTKNQ